MVRALVPRRLQAHLFLLPSLNILNHSLQSPSKATGPVLIDSLKHQQHTPDLENCGADESGPATTNEDLVWEFRGGLCKRELNEEGVYAPYCGAKREYNGDEPGDVPVWIVGEHAEDTAQGGFQSRG